MTLEAVGTERLRRLNTAAVLVALRERGPASRSVLAERTGLAKATIGSIVAHLAARGVVTEGAPESSTRGRPSRPVTLRPSGLLGLGLEVNVDYVAAALVDVGGNVVTSRTVAVDDRPPLEILQELATSSAADAEGSLVGACLAVPGLIEADRRTVAWAPNLGWEQVRPAEALTDTIGVPVTVENDANLAAVAEGAHGAGLDVRSSLYLTGTVGIGAGIVDDGRLVRGAGFAGEVGHMPIGRPEQRCGCGRRGCWEATVGLRSMLRAVDEPEHANPMDSATAVATRARAEEPVREALSELGHRLGQGIASLVSILDPDAVVLGGYFVPLAPWLLPVASRVVDERLPSADRHRPVLRAGALGIEAAAVGAAEHALTGVLDGTVAV